jgi:hypothetical protein
MLGQLEDEAAPPPAAPVTKTTSPGRAPVDRSAGLTDEAATRTAMDAVDPLERHAANGEDLVEDGSGLDLVEGSAAADAGRLPSIKEDRLFW